MPIYLQFNYRSELISKPYIPFNHLLVNNSNAYILPIPINEVKSCASHYTGPRELVI